MKKIIISAVSGISILTAIFITVKHTRKKKNESSELV